MSVFEFFLFHVWLLDSVEIVYFFSWSKCGCLKFEEILMYIDDISGTRFWYRDMMVAVVVIVMRWEDFDLVDLGLSLAMFGGNA
jgi:hypothetical protein